jgi:hypothetical protein
VSWEPLNLRHLDDQPSVEPTLCGLIYLGGTRHAFTGPPESAKTIAAHAVALEHIRADGTVLLVDLEMGARDTRDRLREMGATDDELDRLVYVEPDMPAHPDTVAELIDRFPVQLAVVDAAAGAYSLHGLDDNRRGDVEKFAELLITPLRSRGISTIVIDHVVKKPGDRGGWAIGSERKLGFADVSLGFSATTPFGRGREGLVRIRTNKDRAGHLLRPAAAELVLRSDPETHAISWEFREPLEQEGEGEAFRPTGLMERVSVFLEKQTEPVSRRTIETNVKGKTDYVRRAIDYLVRDGFAAQTDGPYNPLRSVRPFRESDAFDGDSPQFAPDSSQPRPGAQEGAPPSPPSPEEGRVGAHDPRLPLQGLLASDLSDDTRTNPDPPLEADISDGSPCRFPTHREHDWVTTDGRVRCGICHPPAAPRP